MPSFTTYTPLESLLFFQSVASLGASANAFTTISESLSKNQFIRQDESYSDDRLAPKALQELYHTLLKEEAARQNPTNGVVESQENARKRKLSSPPRLSPSEATKEPKFWSGLIDRLYAEYRDHIVTSIKADETKYDSLKLQLRDAENKEMEGTLATPHVLPTGTQAVAGIEGHADSDGPEQSTTNSQGLNGTAHPPSDLPKESKPVEPLANIKRPPTTVEPLPASVKSPRTAVMTVPNKDATVTAVHPEPAVNSKLKEKPVPSPSPATTPQPGMPPPAASPIRPVQSGPTQPTPTPPVNPVMPYPQGPPMYPPHPPPHGWPPQQWQHQSPGPQPHPSLRASPYSHPPMQPDFSGRTPIMARSPQQPQPSQFQQYPYPPHTYNGLQQPYMYSPVQPGSPAPYPWPWQPPSAVSTPVSNRIASMTPHLRTSFSGRSPWKNTPSTTRTEVPRPPSREVSPIPERIAKSIEGMPSTSKVKPSGDRSSMRKPGRPVRKGRAGSVSPSVVADRSRSQSIMSHASDARTESFLARRTIKNETPSTPVPLSASDTIENEQRSTTRRTRGNTLQGSAQPRFTTKRKRGDSIEADEASETPRPHIPAPIRPVVDRDKVYTTRNFSRICGPIMNDVTAHKHAGIFAKPLTERDAPGYRSLIYRPSDLKTIKSMIHAGSRAVTAAIDEAASASTPAGDTTTETASPAVGTTPTPNPAPNLIAGQPKNSAILLDKTPDLIPPKSIVNSAQLEKELLRMFANAVMFNPMPSSERGFGPDVHFTRGGLLDPNSRETDGYGLDEANDASNDQNTASATVEFKGYSNEEDSGSIIRDTREMMADVERAIGIWRDAEMGSITFGEEFSLSGNGGMGNINDGAESIGEAGKGVKAGDSANNNSSNNAVPDTTTSHTEAEEDNNSAATPSTVTDMTGSIRKKRRLAAGGTD